LEIADFLVYVEFDDDWNLIKLLKIPVGEIDKSRESLVVTKDLIKRFNILEGQETVKDKQ
jgi:hypothetical protein